MTKEIPLTQGKVAFVDDQDYEWLSQWKWQAWRDKTGTWYAHRHQYPNHKVKMHRQIMNANDGEIVDHKDTDGLNNTRHNLRFCTNTSNSYNRKTRKDSKTGLKGVHWMQRNRKYQARIQFDGKRLSLGLFKDPIDAAHAYDQAATQYYGEFARLNFPPAT